MTNRSQTWFSPDPSPPLSVALAVSVALAGKDKLAVAIGTVGLLALPLGCTNQVNDEAQIQLIENIANKAPDLAGADDLLHVEGFNRDPNFDPNDIEATPCRSDEGCASLDDLADLEDLAGGSDEIIFASSMSVDQAVWNACSTSVLRALTDQLVAEVECMRPDTMGSIDDLEGITMGSGALPYLQTKAAERLIRARELGGSLHLNSTLRSLAQQFLLYEWSRVGRCGIGLAARPGRSNHESGLAVDVSNWSSRRNAFSDAGWRWLGNRDPVHFDYLGSGTINLRGLSVLAFQRLWNRNNPDDSIAEDGDYGPQTGSRIGMAPTGGFDTGASCNAFGDGPEFRGLEVYWQRLADATYDFRTLANSSVVRIETFIDGTRIAVTSRDDGTNFPENLDLDDAEIQDGEARRLDVVGFDAAGEVFAAGVGYLDIGEGASFSLKQMGDNLFEVYLERAPDDVASINVLVDGEFELVDAISGRAPSPRNAVRAQIQTLGERVFTMSLHREDGSIIETLTRTFDLTARVPAGAGDPEPIEPGPEPGEPDAGEPDPVVGGDDLCDGVGSVGGVLSEEGACVDLGGPSQYLRSVSGDGHEDSYVWTGATSSSTGSNFVQFNLDFAASGEFLVEVSIPENAESRTKSAEYFVRNQGSTKAIHVDQSAMAGFLGVGIFTFNAGAGQFVSLYDNTGENSSLNRRVVFDAIRFTPVSQLSCTNARVNTSGNKLNVRRTASTGESAVDQIDNNATVQGLGTVVGQSVSGNTQWMRIRKGTLTGYVSTSFLTCQN